MPSISIDYETSVGWITMAEVRKFKVGDMVQLLPNADTRYTGDISFKQKYLVVKIYETLGGKAIAIECPVTKGIYFILERHFCLFEDDNLKLPEWF